MTAEDPTRSDTDAADQAEAPSDNDVIDHAAPEDDPYFMTLADPYLELSRGVAHVVGFAGRLEALIWLHRTVTASIDRECLRLAQIERDRSHRVPGWEGECDLMLEDAQAMLEVEAAPISAGAIIVACCSALESLLTDLSSGIARRGLRDKARAVADRLRNPDEAAGLIEHTGWLAQRRNSFAHRLLDDDEHHEQPHHQVTFDLEAVEETFVRCGRIASLLDERYDEITSPAPTQSNSGRSQH